ncbi:MAG: hypothetical protein J6U54_11285 [Clostridiales bacterium]|nr:hypothetical protein [Clostridiales bacterium]
MGNIFEWQVDPKACKYYNDAYDVIFVDDLRELRFCRYCEPMATNIDGKYHMVVKVNNMIVDYITRDRALCYYDRDHHRWCTKINNYRAIYWQVIRPDDNIFINVLVGIAIDEIAGSKTDLSVDDITHRIKSRFGIWYDSYCHKTQYEGRWTSTSAAIKVPDNFYDDSNESVKLYFDNKPVHINTNIKVDELPQPKFVQFNDDYTTVVWKDGTHTTVKRTRGDAYDEEKAIAMAVIKKMCGDNGSEMDRYFKKFFEHSVDISNSKKKKGAKKK